MPAAPAQPAPKVSKARKSLEATAADGIRLTDNRSLEQKKAARPNGFWAPLAFFAENKFSPRAFDRFQAALLLDKSLPRPIEVEVDEFRVADFWPARVLAAQPGLLTSAIVGAITDSHVDWSFIDEANIPRDADSVICIFVGKINGRPVKLVTSETYHQVSTFGVTVYHDDGFKSALDVVIERAAQLALDQASH